MTVARVIWAAMLAATGLYWLVLTVVLREPSTTTPSPSLVRTLWFVFGGLALAITVVVSVMRRTLPALDGANATLTRHIVCWALAESIGLYGLVFGILSRDGASGVPFFVWAMLLLVMLRPPASGHVA